MQTFLPYPSFSESARCLDWRRLGKQRVETSQILDTLDGIKAGWKNHPAVKMWKGYENALAEYGIIICREWRSRGYNDSLLIRFEERINYPIVYPAWLGNEKFHASHQSNLLRKDPVWYGQFGWTVPNNLEYIWNDSN